MGNTMYNFYSTYNSLFQARSQDCKFGGRHNSSTTYCYSLLAMSTVLVTEYTDIVVIK